ncbi:MAG: hypothetical protein ACD_20C00001G0001, partial [uncultured bacterium]
RDSYMQFSAGIYYRFHPNYTLYAFNTYTNNISNVFMYKYNVYEILTGIKFEF